MGEIIPRSNKRTIIDYNDIIALSGDSTVICVNLGVLLILRALIRDRGLWQSTYYQQILPAGLYEQIEDSQFDLIDAMVSDFLGDTDMGTCDELSATLQAIASGQGIGGCGCGTSGAGSTEPAATTTTGPADISNPVGDPPEGFATWDEYRDYRCAVANELLDANLADVQWLQTVNATTLAIGAFAAALVTPIPGDEIIAFVALLSTLTGLGFYASALQDWEDTLQAARDDLECDLYSAANVTDAKTDFQATFDAEVDMQTADPTQRFLIKSLQAIFLNFAALNDLFDKSETYNTTAYDQTDCSQCVECPITVQYGTIQQNGNVYTVTSGNRADGSCPGEWALVWFCETSFNHANTSMKQFTISNYSGPTIDACSTSPLAYSVSETNEDGVASYNSQDTLPPGTRCARRFYIGGLPSQFSFDITVTGDC